MKEKPVMPLVITMAIPMTISMLVNSLYNIIDSFYVAKISEQAMTALSLVYPAQNLLIAVTVGFAIGMNAVISYYLGAGMKKLADTTATLGLFFNILHSLLIGMLCIIGMPAFLGRFSSDPETLRLSTQYAGIVFLFAIPNGAGISYEKMFQAIGRMKVSMISMLVGCIVNIILDPLMIFGIGPFPEMGMAGAAYATGIGQSICLLSYVVFAILRPLPIRFTAANLKPQGKLVAGVYAVGIPATLNMALPSFLISALNGILAPFSDKYILVLGAYYKLQTFIYLTANGIIQGIRPLVSFNYGAGEHRRVQEIFRTTLYLTMGVMVVGVILCLTIPGGLIGLFTSKADTIAIGVTALHIICVGFIVSAVSVTCCGVLEALGAGVSSLMISLLRYLVVIIPAAMLLSRVWGAKGVFAALPVTEFITAVAAILIYRRRRLV